MNVSGDINKEKGTTLSNAEIMSWVSRVSSYSGECWEESLDYSNDDRQCVLELVMLRHK